MAIAGNFHGETKLTLGFLLLPHHIIILLTIAPSEDPSFNNLILVAQVIPVSNFLNNKRFAVVFPLDFASIRDNKSHFVNMVQTLGHSLTILCGKYNTNDISNPLYLGFIDWRVVAIDDRKVEGVGDNTREKGKVLKVGLISGGPSAERGISLNSGDPLPRFVQIPLLILTLNLKGAGHIYLEIQDSKGAHHTPGRQLYTGCIKSFGLLTDMETEIINPREGSGNRYEEEA
ncbi:hypothetical protein LXL04_007260 [Taraxacum kok-saghyz]